MMDKKIVVTSQQRANAEEALHVMWPSVPPENVVPSLSTFREGGRRHTPPTCRTIACFGGWCAWWPGFRNQGVRADDGGAPVLRGGLVAAGPGSPTDVAIKLFGDRNLFRAVGGHAADRWDGTPAHAVVTRRLRWLIKNSVVVRDE